MSIHGNADESSIIRSAQKRDSAAFGVLYKRYYERIYRTVFGLVGNATDAQDVTQVVWLKAWKNIGRFNFTSAFTTWLHRIAVNTALDHLRQRKRQQSRFRSLFSSRKEDSTIELIEIPAPSADPAAGLLGYEGAQSVKKALARLPEAQRVVIVLKEFEDYTYQEIADTIGCKIGTVMSRLHLARQKLRKLLTIDES